MNNAIKKLNMGRLIDKAEDFEKHGLLDKALEEWQKVWKHNQSPEILCRIGNLKLENGDLNGAEQSFTEAIKLAPKLAIAYASLALIYIEEENYETAKSNMQKYLSLKESAWGYNLLGVINYNLSKDKDGEVNFQKALDLDSSYEEAYFNLATLIYKNDFKKSRNFLREPSNWMIIMQ